MCNRERFALISSDCKKQIIEFQHPKICGINEGIVTGVFKLKNRIECLFRQGPLEGQKLVECGLGCSSSGYRERDFWLNA